MKEHYDVIIVGTGAAGLYCALNLPEKMKILLITKQEADQSDSFLAQGGICMLRGEDDYENYFEDTINSGPVIPSGYPGKFSTSVVVVNCPPGCIPS